MLTDLRLQNFRSYSDESFDLGPRVNIIVGPNAIGKTNLLEGILVLATGKSYRSKTNELIRFRQDWSRIDGDFSNGSKRTLKITNELPKKTFEIDEKVYKKLPFDKKLPIVLFEPNNLQLLSSSPERRRDYMDMLLEKTDQEYGSLIRKYRLNLAQRNALLKSQTGNQKQFFIWNLRLSELGGKIVKHRESLIKKLDIQVQPLYKDLSGTNTKIGLKYGPKWRGEVYESSYLKWLDDSTKNDSIKGYTSEGPHRDDLEVFWNDYPASERASRGEVRTIVLTLKILEAKLLEESKNQKPILLLDDVFSELDGKRRHYLTDFLKNYQTFITTTDADIILKNFSKSSRIIPIAY
jgi:DNA replication and repair protein RecF